MNNEHDYISVICTTIVAMLALFSVLIGVIIRSNSSEPKENAFLHTHRCVGYAESRVGHLDGIA